MNILFLSLGEFGDLTQSSVHLDILKRFAENHNVWLVCKSERRLHQETQLRKECGINVLRVKTGNLKRTNLLEKGISTILVEPQFLGAIKKYIKDIYFDLVLYETPPITFAKVVKHIKKRDNATTYLMLKDIFPQNAIDIGMLSNHGIKGIIYRHFRRQETRLYKVSDYIGCMSEANVKYILKNNEWVNPSVVEICPNTINAKDMSVDETTKDVIRRKYDIPKDKLVFVYGGNLGKPQGIPFLIECLKKVNDLQKSEPDDSLSKAFILILGSGTEYNSIKNFIDQENPLNIRLMSSLPGSDYNAMVGACDIGMLFLDHRFTIPNFPSRILSYMQAKLPVLAVTDQNTDVGTVATRGGFGWWCESNSVDGTIKTIKEICNKDKMSLTRMGNIGWNYLINNYSVDVAYNIIMSHMASTAHGKQ